MQVANGTADVTTYFVLRDSTNHAPKTDVTITDIDLYYVEQGAAISAKADATALAAADSAHGDNQAFHVGQGLYRIDWPDTCFNGGVGKVCNLIVVCTGVDTTFLEVELTGVPQTGDAFARLGAPAGASVSADIAAIEAQTDDIGVAGAGLTAITGVTLAATQGAEIADAVWDEALAGHAAAGSTGEALADAATGGGLSAQEVRDALKLAPTAGAPAAGSVDAHLDDILTDTGTTLPADVWAYTTRTLTSTAAATTAAVTGAQLNIGITASYAATLSALTIPATWTKIWFTTKKQLSDTDAAAALQIVVSNPAAGGTDGVLYVEGAAASAAQRTLGSLTINQAGGTVAIAIDETLTASLLPRGGEYYDVKCLESGGACTILTEGRAAVSRTVTRAVA